MPMTAIVKWLSVKDVASLTDIATRNVRKAISRGLWRGTPLVRRQVIGRGGKAGQCYEVALSSLPTDLQAKWREVHPEAAQLLAMFGGTQVVRVRDRRDPETLRGGLDRAVVARDILAAGDRQEQQARLQSYVGKMHRVGMRLTPLGERTLQKWVRAYKRGGQAALERRTRKDAGAVRTVITQRFDAATRDYITADTLLTISGRFRLLLDKMWRTGIDSTEGRAEFATQALYELAREHITPDQLGDGELRAACVLPRHVIERDRHLPESDRLARTDAKAYADKFIPAIKGDRSHLLPMDLVYGDVCHLDLVTVREDGTRAWPKMVTWLDAATNRVFQTVYVLPAGEMIRREHILQSLALMFVHPDWGVPKSLKLDNGSEYGNTPDQWMRCADQAASIETGRDMQRQAINRARPYNARAKGVIEGFFRTFQEGYLSTLLGYVGGKRMAQKSANIGRAPNPYTGTLEELREDIAKLVNDYHYARQGGDLRQHLKTKQRVSPFQAFEHYKARGWQTVRIETLQEAQTMLSRIEVRKIRKGGVSIDSRTFIDVNFALADWSGEALPVLVPFSRSIEVARVLLPTGQVVDLYEQRAVAIDDRSAPRELQSRIKRQKQRRQQRESAAGSADIEAIRERARAARPAPTPTPSMGFLDLANLSARHQAFAAAPVAPRPAIGETPPPAAPARPSIEDRIALLDQFLPRRSDAA